MRKRKKIIGGCLAIFLMILSSISITLGESAENQIEMIDNQTVGILLTPDLIYFPSNHDFGAITEGNTYTTYFDIWNAGTDTLIWNLAIVDTWISITPTSGNSTGEIDTVTVEIDTTGLTPGSYIGKVGITANDGGGIRFFTVHFSIDSPTNSPPNTPDDLVGPTMVEEGVQYTYITSASDPDDDPIKLGLDFNNDGIINEDHWTDYIPSGATQTFHITFYGTGTRYIRVKAEDIYGLQSNFSNPLTVIVTGSNDPPNTPNKPAGPSNGEPHVLYTFSTSATDPNDDDLKYGWDWNGDGIVDEWSTIGTSGSADSRAHAWSTDGTYNIMVLAQDEHGAQSTFSLAKTIVISSNHEPDKPTISGPSSGRIEKSYIYTSTGTDADNDQLYYWFDWGDGTNTGWKGPYTSGQTASESHSWSTQGTFSIKVKTKDTQHKESVWSDPLQVSIPKSKPYINFIMEHYRFLSRFISLI